MVTREVLPGQFQIYGLAVWAPNQKSSFVDDDDSGPQRSGDDETDLSLSSSTTAMPEPVTRGWFRSIHC